MVKHFPLPAKKGDLKTGGHMLHGEEEEIHGIISVQDPEASVGIQEEEVILEALVVAVLAVVAPLEAGNKLFCISVFKYAALIIVFIIGVPFEVR